MANDPFYNFVPIAEGDSKKYVGANDADALIAQATAGTLEHDVSGSPSPGLALTTAQYREYLAHRLTGSASGPFTMTVGTSQRTFVVINESGADCTLSVSGSPSNSSVIKDGESAAFYNNGSGELVKIGTNIAIVPLFIEAPNSNTYTLIPSAPFAGRVLELYGATETNELTATVKINNANVSGLAGLTINTTGATTKSTGSNLFGVGDRIRIQLTQGSPEATDLEAQLILVEAI